MPVAGLPTPLRQIAEINPLTSLATAVRELFGVATGPLPDVLTLQHPVITSLGWARAIMAIFVPLAVRRYQRWAGSYCAPCRSSRSAAASPR